ncbi:MAG: S8 family serine peptidase [Blastocatellia bacterium]|nr:S8 family serine peptidase [Blastocatellia bacterium]
MKSLSRYLLSIMLIFSPLFSLPSSSSAQSPVEKTKLQLEQDLEPSQLGEEAQQQIEAILREKQSRTPEQRKIDSQLWQTIRQRQGQEAVGGVPRVRTAVEVDDQGKTLVEIRTNGFVSEEFVRLLERAQGEVVYVATQHKLMRARLPIDLLESVAQRTDVRSIRMPAPVMTNRRLMHQGRVTSPRRETLELKAARLRTDFKRVLTGAPTVEAEPPPAAIASDAVVTGPPFTQGDAAHRANDVRNVFGVDGTGVKIGVLSDSIRYLERSQDNGNLPKDVTVLPGQSGITREGFDEGEGTAMLEIIHDLAPGAKLFFATGTSDIEGPEGMARNIRDLRFKYGCDIIVDDIIWADQLPFQDYTLAQAVNDVTKAGALYFSSAGNAGNYNDGTSGTWQGDFKNAGRQPLTAGPSGDPLYTFHDFGGGLISNRISRTFGDGFVVVRLFWSDPEGAAQNDFDIYILNSTLTSVRAFSIDDQSVFPFPGEGVATFMNQGDRILIANYNGSQPRALYLDTFGTAELALTTGGYIAGQAAAADAFAVAAVPSSVARNGVFVPGLNTPVEVFSSDGPRHIFFNADGSPVTPGKYLFADGGVVRQKPDLAAADGVSTSLPQSFFSTFFGTSAAAPHAAAIAALLKSAVPAIKTGEMREVLTSTALDIGPRGVDRVSGAGVVSALNAYLKAKPSPFLEFASAELAAGPGDRDGAVEPGEEGLLQVAFVNTGTAPATGVKASITTSTPGVTITGVDSDYFQIPEGKGGVNLRHFRFRLAPTAACGLRPTFTVNVSSDQTLSRSYSFAVQTGQPATTPAVLSLRNGNIPLPDGSTISLSLPVSGFTAPITRFAFRFDGPNCSSPTGVGLQHDRVSDLVVTLTSPAGTTVTLLSNPGGLGLPSKNFCNTLLDDFALNSIQNITSAGAPYSGIYRPSGRLASFNGQSANGTWTLRVSDRVQGTTGTLRNFSFLIFTYSCDSGAAGVQEFRFSTN